MALVRRGLGRTRGLGFLVTWDVDSKDRSRADRLFVFIWGKTVRKGDRLYVYEGFVRKEGVRYIGQSVLFVHPHRLAELVNFLEKCGVDHAIDRVAFF